MGKYDALGAFLRRWRVRNDAPGVELSLAQIENILRGVLPRAASDPQWWSMNGQDEPPHRRAWREAGFDAVPDMAADRVYFQRR